MLATIVHYERSTKQSRNNLLLTCQVLVQSHGLPSNNRRRGGGYEWVNSMAAHLPKRI